MELHINCSLVRDATMGNSVDNVQRSNFAGGATRVSSDLRTDFTHNGVHCLVGIALAPSYGAWQHSAWGALELSDKITTMWSDLS